MVFLGDIPCQPTDPRAASRLLTDARKGDLLRELSALCMAHSITIDVTDDGDMVLVPIDHHSTHSPGARWHEFDDHSIWWQR